MSLIINIIIKRKVINKSESSTLILLMNTIIITTTDWDSFKHRMNTLSIIIMVIKEMIIIAIMMIMTLRYDSILK